MTNPYEILQVPQGSSWEQVEASFRRLAQIHHPSNGGNQHHFAQLLAAYEMIRSYVPPAGHVAPLQPPTKQPIQTDTQVLMSPKKNGIPPPKGSSASGKATYTLLSLRVLVGVVTAGMFSFVSFVVGVSSPSRYALALLLGVITFFATPSIVVGVFRRIDRIVLFGAAITLLLSWILPATVLLFAIFAYYLLTTAREHLLNR